MFITWIILAYIFIVSSLNAIIDYDMSFVSKGMVRLPISDAMINFLTVGLYSVMYFNKRKYIKEGFTKLITLLEKMHDEANDDLAELYLSYKNCKYQPQSPVYTSILNDVEKRLMASVDVTKSIKESLIRGIRNETC